MLVKGVQTHAGLIRAQLKQRDHFQRTPLDLAHRHNQADILALRLDIMGKYNEKSSRRRYREFFQRRKFLSRTQAVADRLKKQ